MGIVCRQCTGMRAACGRGAIGNEALPRQTDRLRRARYLGSACRHHFVVIHGDDVGTRSRGEGKRTARRSTTETTVRGKTPALRRAPTPAAKSIRSPRDDGIAATPALTRRVYRIIACICCSGGGRVVSPKSRTESRRNPPRRDHARPLSSN